MLRYTIHLVLFFTALLCVRQMLQTADVHRADTASRVEARRLPPPISVAEAWRRYHEAARRGIPCDGDVPPHPAVVAAVLLIISLRTLTRPLRASLA